MATTYDVLPFLSLHRLPAAYAALAEQWFHPCFETIIARQREADKPLILGINGSQGSGKSTLAALFCDYATSLHQCSAIALSIDDFYLPRDDRIMLGNTIHPLLKSRGVPGTHDIDLACDTLRALCSHSGTVAVPRFNKATDDREAATNWPRYNSPIDIIVFEGWCLGAKPQTSAQLASPCNDLEANEDPSGVWRRYVNTQLAETYPALFALVDCWLMLQAPSFDCVYNWRLEQEQKLLAASTTNANTIGIMNPDQVARFVEHYQRLTEHCLNNLPARVDHLYTLDTTRQITSYRGPQP